MLDHISLVNRFKLRIFHSFNLMFFHQFKFVFLKTNQKGHIVMFAWSFVYDCLVPQIFNFIFVEILIVVNFLQADDVSICFIYLVHDEMRSILKINLFKWFWALIRICNRPFDRWLHKCICIHIITHHFKVKMLSLVRLAVFGCLFYHFVLHEGWRWHFEWPKLSIDVLRQDINELLCENDLLLFSQLWHLIII